MQHRERKPQTPARTRGTDTLTRILDAAEQLFAHHGYGGASLRAVAAAVGIQNPSIYAHFESKQALYEAVLARAIRPILEEFWEDENELGLLLRHLVAHPHFAHLLLEETTSEQPSPPVVTWLRATLERTREWHARVHPTSALDDADLTLRVIASLNLTMGYFASGELVRALTGKNPLGKAMLERQMMIVEKVSRALFAEEGGA